MAAGYCDLDSCASRRGPGLLRQVGNLAGAGGAGIGGCLDARYVPRPITPQTRLLLEFLSLRD
jgi:hypothetical protein